MSRGDAKVICLHIVRSETRNHTYLQLSPKPLLRNGEHRHPFTVKTRVRIPLGTPPNPRIHGTPHERSPNAHRRSPAKSSVISTLKRPLAPVGCRTTLSISGQISCRASCRASSVLTSSFLMPGLVRATVPAASAHVVLTPMPATMPRPTDQ